MTYHAIFPTSAKPLCGVKVQVWDYGTRDLWKINCAACLGLLNEGRMINSDKFKGRTPGPWVAYDRGIGWEIHADGRAINEDFRETFIRADAELCAAAPELLAENERAHEFFEAINGAIHEAVSAKPIVPGAALVELILLFPPRILNPNNRAHWSTKAKAAKSYKRECWAVAKHSGWFGREFTPKVHLWIDFYPPDKRPYDDDNIAAAFKAGRDGIASALGIDDKRFVSHPTLFPFSKDFKGVKVRITDSP